MSEENVRRGICQSFGQHMATSDCPLMACSQAQTTRVVVAPSNRFVMMPQQARPRKDQDGLIGLFPSLTTERLSFPGVVVGSHRSWIGSVGAESVIA